MGIRKSPATGAAPPLLVRTQGPERRLRPGSAYLIGRDPLCDIVISDAHVSWQHAVLRVEDGRWVLSDNGSTNGIYAGDRRVDRIAINGECLARLSDPADGPALSFTAAALSDVSPGEGRKQRRRRRRWRRPARDPAGRPG